MLLLVQIEQSQPRRLKCKFAPTLGEQSDFQPKLYSPKFACVNIALVLVSARSTFPKRNL